MHTHKKRKYNSLYEDRELYFNVVNCLKYYAKHISEFKHELKTTKLNRRQLLCHKFNVDKRRIEKVQTVWLYGNSEILRALKNATMSLSMAHKLTLLHRKPGNLNASAKVVFAALYLATKHKFRGNKPDSEVYNDITSNYGTLMVNSGRAACISKYGRLCVDSVRAIQLVNDKALIKAVRNGTKSINEAYKLCMFRPRSKYIKLMRSGDIRRDGLIYADAVREYNSYYGTPKLQRKRLRTKSGKILDLANVIAAAIKTTRSKVAAARAVMRCNDADIIERLASGKLSLIAASREAYKRNMMLKAEVEPVNIEDVNGLIQNPYKNLVRQGIINQTRDMLTQLKPGTPLKAVTLPGTNFVFEQMLTNTLAYDDRHAEYDCFERVRSRYVYNCRKGVPINVHLHYGDFDNADLDDCQWHNLFWADYCCTASNDAINSAVDRAAKENDRDVLLYITFCLSRKNTKQLIKSLSSSRPALIDAIADAVERRLTLRGKRFKKVSSVAYPGGKESKTPMLTVGYLINPTVKLKVITSELRFNLANKGLHTIRPRRNPNIKLKSHTCNINIRSTNLQLVRAYLHTYAAKKGYASVAAARKSKKFKRAFVQAAMHRFGITHHQPVGVITTTGTKGKVL